jgi:hypothetical protein
MSDLRWTKTQDSKEWDRFMSENGGSVFHSWSWRRVRESVGDRPLYLVCRDGKGTIIAACPFFYRKASRYLVYLESLQWSPIGGPVVSGQLGEIPEVIKSLQNSVKFSITNPVVSLQLRVHQQPMVQILTSMRFRYNASQGLFILNLASKTPQDIWKNGFQKHDRQAVKYYEERASSFTFARSDSDFTDYVALHQETMRRMGETPRSLDYLSSMRLNFGEQFKIALVTFENRLIAGFAMICDAKSSTVYLGLNIGYSRTKNIHSPMIFMNWKVVNWASENGLGFVNFGVADSKSSDPVHKIKQKFGPEFVPIYRFTIPTSNIPYKFARRIGRALRGVRGSAASNDEA